MSDKKEAATENAEQNDVAVGRLKGKTTANQVNVIITNPNIRRSNYFTIFIEEGEQKAKKPYILSIAEMWQEKDGLMAILQVIGERPQIPFTMGAEVYLAKDDDIKKVLGISNIEGESLSIGKLLGYPFEVNLLVKNFGRIFITGKSGSGKSYTMGVLCEEFLKKGIPVVILDRHGEYAALKVKSEETECKEEKKPGETGESEYADKIIEFADLNLNNGADIDIEYLFSLDAKDIVAPNLCTIINLRGMELEVQEIIAGKILKKLYQASTSRFIPPFYLFLDEAHLFAGKKQTQTCDTVKLFSQEGRKFGANIVIGTQRPQLLDTTIRAQAGTWIVHQLSDIRDIGITISSAEDLSKENEKDISGLEKGQAIICGEAVKGIPLFVKVRKRKTKHGGTGFNPLDFLSPQTVEELKKRKERILGRKSQEDLEQGKADFKDLFKPKSPEEYIEENKRLTVRIKELEATALSCTAEGGSEASIITKLNEKIMALEAENQSLKTKLKVKEMEASALSGTAEGGSEALKKEVKKWKDMYDTLKQMKDKSQISSVSSGEDPEKIVKLNDKIKSLEAEVQLLKSGKDKALALAEKSISELKKKK